MATTKTAKKTTARVELLDNWVNLSGAIKDMTEEEAKALLDAERTGRKRAMILMRLHMRFNKMRGQRERRELMSEV